MMISATLTICTPIQIGGRSSGFIGGNDGLLGKTNRGMDMIVYIALLLIIGGTWIAQDGIASILFYLKRDDERWHFNHAVRLFRVAWGIVFIACGIIMIIWG